jgi:hypothetical protein
LKIACKNILETRRNLTNGLLINSASAVHDAALQIEEHPTTEAKEKEKRESSIIIHRIGVGHLSRLLLADEQEPLTYFLILATNATSPPFCRFMRSSWDVGSVVEEGRLGM